MRLFELADEMRALTDLMENDCEFDLETGEVTDNTEIIQRMFNELSLSFGDKLDSSAYVVNTIELQSQALKDEAKRLSQRAKRLEENATVLKNMMLSALMELPDKKLKTLKFTFGTRKSESIQIEEGFNMQGRYVRVKEIREPDKVAIKEALKGGQEIIGVSVITNIGLSIR